MSMFAPIMTGLVAGGVFVLAQGALTPAVQAQTEAAPQTPVRQCVSGGNLDTTVIDEKTLLVEDRGRGALLLKVSGCRLSHFDPLLFEYRGTTQICQPIDVQMSVIYAPGFKSACFVDELKPISLDEAKSIKADLNKKKKAK